MLYLIRHAKTIQDFSRTTADWDLDPAGFPALERMKAEQKWDAIPHWYASSEPKALLTARYLTTNQVQMDDRLRELDRGAGNVADYGEAVRSLFAEPDRPAIPGWETGARAQARMVAAMDDILARHAGEDVAVVTHGLVIALWMAHRRGQERVDMQDWGAVGFPDCAIIGEAGVVQPFRGR